MENQNKEEDKPQHSGIIKDKTTERPREGYQGSKNFQPRNDYRPRPNSFQKRDDNRPRTNNFQPRTDNRNVGERKPFTPNTGERRDFRDNRSFTPRPSFTDRKSFEERKKLGEHKPLAERKNFAEKKNFRDNRVSQPARSGGFQPRGKFQPKGKPVKLWEENLPKIVSEMQLTDGKHRGKYLKTTESKKVRPTTRRIREVMFRLIYRRVKFSRFLDLCAGSGMVGLEALSRGALMTTFVERSAKMCSFINKNLENCGIKAGHCEVEEIEVVPFLKRANKKKRQWDVIYFDPPYDSNYEEVLEVLGKGFGLSKKACVVVEHHSEMFFPEKIGCLNRFKVIVNGDTALSFFERR
jgi:16S rRNA (guanine966-N2)-methyltransferase